GFERVGRVVASILTGKSSGAPPAPHLQAKATPGEQKEAVPTIRCPDCKQAIDISGLGVGSDITCPGCQAEFTLTSPDEALPPLPADEKKPGGLGQINTR
ncbi:unnamed protein product, partial [marine sediment metagenome]